MISWITDWLGTAAYDELENGDWVVVDVRQHVDKAGNRPEALRGSIDAALAHRRAGSRVVVACDFGISRSNAIAAGVLSRAEPCPYDSALARVAAATGNAEIKLEMATSVRVALGEPPTTRPGTGTLLTGGSGFIGRRLTEMVEPGEKVLAPPRAELDLLRGSVALARYCERERVRQIVHLAYPRHYTNPSALGESLTMLQAVLAACRELGLRLVFVSSWVVFSGYAAQRLLADESLASSSKGNYGDVKLLEEALVNAFAARVEVRAAICRFAPVYGPGGTRPRLIRTFAEAIAAGRIVSTHRYRNGIPALDLLHVDDAARGLRGMMRSDAAGIFHFGTGRLTETPALAACLARLLGRPLQHEELRIDDDVGNIAMDSTKALRELGWRATIDIENGLAEMLASGDIST